MSDQTAQPDSTKPLRGAKGTSEGYPEGPGFMNRRGVLRAFGASRPNQVVVWENLMDANTVLLTAKTVHSLYSPLRRQWIAL